MSYEALQFVKDGPVGVLTFNRPEAMNAMNYVMINEFRDFFKERFRDHDTRVIVLTGAGKAFNAGMDMIGIAYLLSSEVSFSLWFFYLFRRIQLFTRLAFGITSNSNPFFTLQTTGGYIVLAAALLYSAREHLRRARRRGKFDEIQSHPRLVTPDDAVQIDAGHAQRVGGQPPQR